MWRKEATLYLFLVFPDDATKTAIQKETETTFFFSDGGKAEMGRRINGIMRPFSVSSLPFAIFFMDLKHLKLLYIYYAICAQIISILVLLSLIYHSVGILRRNATIIFCMLFWLCTLLLSATFSNDIYTNIAILQSYIRASDARALTCILRTVQFCSQ